MADSLLMVIPPVAIQSEGEGEVRLDKDFANNLVAYLNNFSEVTVLCPPMSALSVAPGSTVALRQITGFDRAHIILLPEPYREDRYLRFRSAIRKLIADQIDKADLLLVSPHAPFDWSTLAARIAIQKGRSYDMEGDWHLENVSMSIWREMPFGLNKVRKYLWIRAHTRTYLKCMRASSVALLQGGDVYEAYKNVAPNPHKVLNIQITSRDVISESDMETKIASISRGEPLVISYAGRAIDMKGPREWLKTLEALSARGVAYSATWFGAGILLDKLRAEVKDSRLGPRVVFAGAVDRKDAMDAIRQSHIFLFCHKTAESPRNLVEALACAAPLVGFESLYARDLTSSHGGGVFVPIGDTRRLADLVAELDQDRRKLSELARQAFRTAHLFDRDDAIQTRIDLIKEFAARSLCQ